MVLRSIFMLFPVLALSCAEPFRCDQSLTCRLSSDASPTQKEADAGSEPPDIAPMEEGGAPPGETDDVPSSGEGGAPGTPTAPSVPPQGGDIAPTSTGTALPPEVPEVHQGSTDDEPLLADAGNETLPPDPEPPPAEEDASTDEQPVEPLDAGFAPQPEPVTEPEPPPETDSTPDSTDGGGIDEPEPEDVDHCEVDNGGCDAFAECTSTATGAECGACREGYRDDGGQCAPVLLSLTSSGGALSPALQPDVQQYTLRVPLLTESVTLTPAAAAGVSINVGGTMVQSGAAWSSGELAFGSSPLAVTLTQMGRPTTQYSLTLLREDEPAYLQSSTTGEAEEFGATVSISADATTLAVGVPGADSAATLRGAVDVYVRDGEAWQRQIRLKAFGATSSNAFGRAVALSGDGNWLAVGNATDSSAAVGIGGDPNAGGATSSGAVFVYAREGVEWTPHSYIKASNTEAGDAFGGAVAMSNDGTTLLVGAYSEDAGNGVQSDNSVDSAGAAYVFERSGEDWSQTAYLKAETPEPNAVFGGVVALSSNGTTLAVTSNESADAQAGEIIGAVWVFELSGGNWTRGGRLRVSPQDGLGRFGTSVALSADGGTIASGDNVGAAYVFRKQGSSWSQLARVTPSNDSEFSYYGAAISVSGDGRAVAVGALGERGAATGVNGDGSDQSLLYAGAVYLYSERNGAWSQDIYLKAPNTSEGDQFGYAVGFSSESSSLVVGANALLRPGAVYVYR